MRRLLLFRIRIGFQWERVATMKILLISDIHANIDALRAVEAAEGQFDLLLCAGDFVDWGFDPHEVIAWFRTQNFIAVSGNHDRYLLKLWDDGEREPVGRETCYAQHCLNRLTEEDVAFLRALPRVASVQADGFEYRMCHSPREERQADLLAEEMVSYRLQPLFDTLWGRLGGGEETPHNRRRMIFGHTHQSWMYQARGGGLFLNPGSIHYRKGPDAMETGADYMVIVDGVPMFRHVDYPTAHLRERIVASSFTPEIKRAALIYAGSAVD